MGYDPAPLVYVPYETLTLRHFLLRRSLRAVTCLAALLTLVSCVTNHVREEIDAVAQSRACCASFAELPAPIRLVEGQTVTFDNSSPHFDFGRGLVPFVLLALEENHEQELIVNLRAASSAWILGAMGTFKYVGLEAVFLSSDGAEMSRSEMSTPRLDGRRGFWFSLRRYVQIPPGASTVVLAANLAESGKKSAIGFEAPEGGIMVGSMFIPSGGSEEIRYIFGVYGKFDVEFVRR